MLGRSPIMVHSKYFNVFVHHDDWFYTTNGVLQAFYIQFCVMKKERFKAHNII